MGYEIYERDNYNNTNMTCSLNRKFDLYTAPKYPSYQKGAS